MQVWILAKPNLSRVDFKPFPVNTEMVFFDLSGLVKSATRADTRNLARCLLGYKLESDAPEVIHMISNHFINKFNLFKNDKEVQEFMGVYEKELKMEGRMEGEVRGEVKLLYNKLNYSDNQIAQELDKPIEVIQEVLEQLRREGKVK